MSQRTRRGPRKVSCDDTRKHTYQGYRFIEGIRKLLARLASHKDCANRLLHYDEYATLILSYQPPLPARRSALPFVGDVARHRA